MNQQQMNGYYSQATKMAEELYEHMTETFAKTPCVVYCVNVARWHDHVSVDTWICIGLEFASDEVRELVGNVSLDYSFAPWRCEKADEFIKQVKDKADAFLCKAKGVQGIVDKEQ
jgi:hypothetical protein